LGTSIEGQLNKAQVDILALRGALSVVTVQSPKVIIFSSLLMIDRCMYVFLLNHAKAVISAAVRLGLVGPYQAQTILATSETRRLIQDVLNEVRNLDVDDAGQTWALLDIYQGRQEILYSRVFNG
jgi:urease accessory protein